MSDFDSDFPFPSTQPSVTVVNINADASPSMFRVDPENVGNTEVLLRIATWLKEEDAIIINLTLTAASLSIIAALKDNWLGRFCRALHGPGWIGPLEKGDLVDNPRSNL